MIEDLNRKDWKLTTLAIVGGGILGRSLLFALKEKNSFDEILFFESPDFSFPCALRSTAIVAPRGVTAGHSPLGDQIVEGFKVFREHAETAKPRGVYPITQFTGAKTKLEKFKERYPLGEVKTSIEGLPFSEAQYIATEEAFMIDPKIYLDWLLAQSLASLPIRVLSEFVTDLKMGAKVTLKTQAGNTFEVDQVVFATGAASRFWSHQFPGSILKSSQPSHGAYLAFPGVDWQRPSFSLTFEGCNLIYHAHSKRLLLGSTTKDHRHVLPDEKDLREVYSVMQTLLEEKLPDFAAGERLVGLREKATKRRPYVYTEGPVSFMGGLYKNGYTLSLMLAREFFSR